MTEATIVIVNYRSGSALGRCLDSVMADPPAKVVVVDNSPGDPSIEPAVDLARSHANVEVVAAGANLGLAGAVNLVLPDIVTPVLIPLNPDTVVHPGWWQTLCQGLDDDPGAAVACPLILIQDTETVNSLGQHLHVAGFGFNQFLGMPAGRIEGSSRPVPGLHGTAFAIRTEVLRLVGGWDTTGFLYHEDVALSWSVRLAGWEILGVPAAVIEHDYHLTMSPQKLHLLERNRWALLLSHLSARTRVVLSPVLVGGELLILALCLVRGPEFLRAKWSTWSWLRDNRLAIAEWRDRVDGFRSIPDRTLISGLRWTFPISQGRTLARERGPSRRVPPGGLPTQAD